MLNIINYVDEKHEGGSTWSLYLGDSIAWLEAHEDDEYFEFKYEIGGEWFYHLYPISAEGIENALWEWCVTLDKLVSGRGRRLGYESYVAA